MATKQSGKLKVATSGKRNYIDVPSGQAHALHRFLLTHNIQVFPPQPCCTGMDTIDLRICLDLKAVQDLLDNWS